jgi:hypothetical protein
VKTGQSQTVLGSHVIALIDQVDFEASVDAAVAASEAAAGAGAAAAAEAVVVVVAAAAAAEAAVAVAVAELQKLAWEQETVSASQIDQIHLLPRHQTLSYLPTFGVAVVPTFQTAARDQVIKAKFRS